MEIFDQVFRIVVGEEGGFTNNAADPGNWTGGTCGKGVCRGTKYGIAASAHPNLDIINITLEKAKDIYRSEYWSEVHGEELPPPLALLVFDAAVNCGQGNAVRWLQAAVGVTQDAKMGLATIAAIHSQARTGAELCAEFQARRLRWMTALPTWQRFGFGWSRRLCRLPYESLSMEAPWAPLSLSR